MQDAIAKSSDALLEKGVLGIAVVLLMAACVWMMFENRKISNARIDDAKQNAKDMLTLANQVNQDQKQNTKDVTSQIERLESAVERLEKRP